GGVIVGERRVQAIPPLPPLPRPAAVAHDREEPGTRVPVAKAGEKAKRPQRRVLHRILRVVLVAQQIAGERVRVVEMRQDQRFEPLDLLWYHGVPFQSWSAASFTTIQTRAAMTLFPCRVWGYSTVRAARCRGPAGPPSGREGRLGACGGLRGGGVGAWGASAARQTQGERAALADGARRRQRAAHATSEIAADRQPEPDALLTPRRTLAVDLDEWVEDAREVRLGNAAARVAHADEHVRGGRIALHGDPTAGFGELHRVRDEIQQHLANLFRVAMDGEIIDGHLLFVRETFCIHLRAHEVLETLHQGRDADVADVELHLSRLELGEIQDVVDE